MLLQIIIQYGVFLYVYIYIAHSTGSARYRQSKLQTLCKNLLCCPWLASNDQQIPQFAAYS